MEAPSLHPPSETLLIIDDDPLMTDLFRQLMTKRGFHVLVAASGHEALALIQARPDDIKLVITDMTMPEMDGLAVAAALAHLAPRLPVLIATGLDADTAQFDLPRNVVGMVQKPYQNRALAERIREILDAA